MSEESKTPVPVEEPPVDLKAERRAAAKVARAARAEKAKAESKGKVVAEVAPPAKSSAPAKKVVYRGAKMSYSQKSELKTHMTAFHADGKMTVSQGKSQRMKVMSRMRKGMTLEDAVADAA